MEGNVVTAAKWLGSSIVLASLILVAGMRWALTAEEREQDQDRDRPAITAGSPTIQGDPLPGEMEQLTRSFRETATAPGGTAKPPGSFFGDEPAGPTPAPARGVKDP